jgi:3D (Asp-Asp-Asp) domain-containing protein
MKGLVLVITVAMLIIYGNANSTATAAIQNVPTSALFRADTLFLKESITAKYSAVEYRASLWELWSPLLPTRKITAYASVRRATASGERVRYGIVAANFLPLGARIKIPALFGNKVFIVKDRTHSRFHDRVDVWMPRITEAKRFGVRSADVIVVGFLERAD